MYSSISEFQKQASNYSTRLVFEHRLPDSDFEFFVNKIDFARLTSQNVFEYHKKLYGYKSELFFQAYNNYKKAYTGRNAPNSYSVSLSKLYRQLPMK